MHALAGEIGPRGMFRPHALRAAAEYIRGEMQRMGYAVTAEPVIASGRVSHNLIAERPGTEPDGGIWLAAAHYDTVASTPGADDNASAVAALLEMARDFTERAPRDTMRFAAFTNEEFPHFASSAQGAMVHAAGCRDRRERIRLMASLEMLGYYNPEPGSQRYPLGLSACYPDTGDFLALIGLLRHGRALRRLVAAFREATNFPCEYLATPFWLPALVRSDHFAFWQHGFPSVMATDTADFRNPHYHGPSDTPDTLDYPALARVTQGLSGAFARLSHGQ